MNTYTTRWKNGVSQNRIRGFQAVFGLGLACFLSSTGVFATPPPNGVAPVLVPAGGFGIDGDLMANPNGAGDWLGGTNALMGVLKPDGSPVNPTTTFHFKDPFSTTSDTIFGGGLKWTDNPNAWTWTTSKASGKTDINNVLVHIANDTDGHTWTIIAADRASTSGDSYIDFEFLQSSLVKNSNGTFSTTTNTGGRTVNDLLLSLAFTGGGSVADFLAYQWQPNGSGGYAYVDVTASLPVGKVFVALNSNSIAVPYGAFGLTTYSANAFAEAALDLTALFGSFDQCLSVGFKTIMVKTKSSSSSSASINDFLDPIQYSLRIGPSANAGPDQARCTEGDSTAFPLSGQASAGMQPIASTTWSVVSGAATIDDPSSLQTTAHVSSATATLRLTVIEQNGCTETDDVVLTVAPIPGCAITGASLLCPRSTNSFQAPTGMSGYAWTISGNGSISGNSHGQTVSVISGAACGTTFTLSLVCTSGICSSACSTDVLVADTTPPTIVAPPDFVLDCPANTATNATGVATAQDDCGRVSVSYVDTVTSNCGNTKVIARNWIAVDGCGNSNNAVQTITVRDITPPSLTIPANLTLECPANTNTSNTGIATAQDGCGAVTVTFIDAVSNNCGGASIIQRLWTATDACGNTTNRTQIITVRDSTAPSLTIPSNLTLECPADTSTNSTGTAIAQDGCGAVNLIYSDVVSNTCGGSMVIRRTWIASDGCGNSTNKVQVITVRDTTRPSLTLPSDLTLECPANTTTNNTGVPTVVDTCSAVQVTFTDSVTNNCGATFTITRKWTATDACGNSTNGIQKIVVRDTTPPNLLRPGDLTLECPANTSTNNTGVATAQDGCGSATVSFSDSIITNCGGTRVIARNWVARDACGNITNSVQTITVRDSTPPSLICPANITLECPGNTNVSNTGIATAVDGCGSVTVTFSDSISNVCGAARVIARKWTATDACGNITNATQLITVRDTTPPSLSLPANLVLECPANTNTSNTGVATAADGCGSVTVSFSDIVSNSCGGTRVISRVWSAVDSCGNSTNKTQTITVIDSTAPTLTIPSSVTLECPADTSTNNTGVATALDGCGSVVVTYTDSVTNNCGNTKIIARTWKATDSCGNVTTRVQTITVRDSTPPSLTLPGSLVLECPANTNVVNTGVATAQDGCGNVTVTFSDSVSNTCGGAKIIRRTWVATDQCGNSTNGVQTITVRDSTSPTLTIPANVVLECPSTNTSTNYTGVATAQDGCSTAVVTYSDSITTNCGPTKVIARTWTATDSCGNSTNAVQTITIRDTLKPSLTVPANVVLECPANTTTNNTGVATAIDGCSQVTVRFSDSISNSCGGAKVISRLWTASDQCGNTTNAVQLITIVDTHPPTITAPPNLVLDCPANTSPSNTGFPVAQDGCSTVTITYTDVVTNYCGGTKLITRTWTASDPCGNAASALQTITIRDITPPSLKLPANVVLQCPGNTATNNTGVPIVSDGCGSVVVTYSDVVSNSCGQTRTVQRLWTATDQCGNTTNGLQTISVVDTTKPTIACPTISVQCVGDIPPAYTNMAQFLAAGGTATDSCSSPLTFALISDSGLVGRCPGTVTRVYRVMDVCGNYNDGTQRITVDDTIPPVITCPTNATVEYGLSINPTNTGFATATDNCSTNIAITYSDSTVGSSYSVNFYAADPDTGSGPYSPTYVKLGPASLPCPTSAILTGRAVDPLRNAVAYGPTASTLDALTSLGGATMYMGQIVPFEAVIGMSGGPGPERGTIEFSASWATYSTANNHFGFDTNYMVYCAFVDAGDPGIIDPNNNARVESVSSTLINQGTIDEQIVGTFRVSGIDPGDQIVVEIWMVLDSTQPGNGGGTIASQLVSAAKYLNPPEPISVGSKTISIGSLNKMGPLPAPQQQPPPIPPTQQAPVPPGVLMSVINRTWTATDDCGNPSSCTQQINVRDTLPPLLVLPPNLVLECPADTSTNNCGVATGTDPNGPVTIFCTESVTNGCAGTRVIARLWTAIDHVGNTTNAVQTIRVQDSIPPSLLMPPDFTLECPANTSTNNTGVATALDGCGSATVTFSDSVSNTCGGTYVLRRIWTAVDTCGNATNAIQTITVRDSTAPSLTVPAGLTLECPADSSTNHCGMATAQDGCGSVTITFSDTVSNAYSGAYVIKRLWAATDSCGNTSTGIQAITVLDTTRPNIKLPGNVTLECPADTSTNNTGVAIASDTCSSVQVAFSDAVTTNCGATFTISRRWTATDAAGNYTNGTQLITVRDSTPPTISLPANITLECPANTNTINTGVATAQDGCGSVIVTFTDSVSNSCGGTKVISRIWSATDSCGNTTNATQFITVRDSTPPTLMVPSDLVLECPSITTTNYTGAATATDGCSQAIVSFADVLTTNAGISRIISRNWTATDSCGNSTNRVQTITIRDTTPPSIVALLINTVSQGTNAAQLLPSGFVSAFPNGLTIGIYNPTNGATTPNGLLWQPNTNGIATLQIALTQDKSAGDPGGPVTKDALNPTNSMGGGSLTRQAILLSLNIGFNSSGMFGPGPNNFGSLIYTSPADPLSGQKVSQILSAANQALAGLGTPPGYDFISLAALLANLNAAFPSYVASPWATAHLSAPMLQVQCAGQVPPPDTDFVTASDSCGGSATITNPPDALISFVTSNNFTLRRTWIARDQAGNTNACSYLIVVRDTTPPILTIAPTLKFASFNEAWSFGTPSATDNCGPVTVSVVNTTTNSTPTNTIIFARTWLATDAALNTNSCTQMVIIQLGPAPAITSQPGGETIGFGDTGNLSVKLGGIGPFTYQWRFNGTNIAGATNITYNFAALRYTSAGLYTVVVTYNGMSTTSGVAVVNVAPKLLESISGRTMTLSWFGPFKLQSASNLKGPWSDVMISNADQLPSNFKSAPNMSPAASPYSVTMTGRQTFFRLRSDPAIIALKRSGGQNNISLTGPPGENYIIQASTNLTQWVNLQTNTLPASMVEPFNPQYRARYYRAQLAH